MGEVARGRGSNTHISAILDDDVVLILHLNHHEHLEQRSADVGCHIGEYLAHTNKCNSRIVINYANQRQKVPSLPGYIEERP